MGSEAEPKQTTIIPKLPLFTIPPLMQSPERSGTLTPPLHTSAAVPFRWEEQPGKPRPCTALIALPTPIDLSPKCLELPPRLLVDSKFAKLPSPTTVLEGPYVGGDAGGSARFKSPSFRMSNDCYGSFRSERGQLGAMVLSGTKNGFKGKGWFFGSWKRKGFKVKREVNGGSHVFPSSAEREGDFGGLVGDGEEKVKMAKIRRTGSFSSLNYAKPGFWVSFNVLVLCFWVMLGDSLSVYDFTSLFTG